MLLSTPGLDKRFTACAAYFLDRLLVQAVQTVITSPTRTQSVLARFEGVYVGDSTVVALPALAPIFQGSNDEQDAAVKVSVEWEVERGVWNCG